MEIRKLNWWSEPYKVRSIADVYRKAYGGIPWNLGTGSGKWILFVKALAQLVAAPESISNVADKDIPRLMQNEDWVNLMKETVLLLRDPKLGQLAIGNKNEMMAAIRQDEARVKAINDARESVIGLVTKHAAGPLRQSGAIAAAEEQPDDGTLRWFANKNKDKTILGGDVAKWTIFVKVLEEVVAEGDVEHQDTVEIMKLANWRHLMMETLPPKQCDFFPPINKETMYAYLISKKSIIDKMKTDHPNIASLIKRKQKAQPAQRRAAGQVEQYKIPADMESNSVMTLFDKASDEVKARINGISKILGVKTPIKSFLVPLADWMDSPITEDKQLPGALIVTAMHSRGDDGNIVATEASLAKARNALQETLAGGPATEAVKRRLQEDITSKFDMGFDCASHNDLALVESCLKDAGASEECIAQFKTNL